MWHASCRVRVLRITRGVVRTMMPRDDAIDAFILFAATACSDMLMMLRDVYVKKSSKSCARERAQQER